jgi:N-methylhydantoinase B
VKGMEKMIDPITFEVIKNALDSIADEMALVVMRSGYSPVVRDSLDFSTAICDSQGHVLAQGLCTALHLGSFPDAMQHLIREYAEQMRPGDIFVMNDPYGSGGMHLPDIYTIKPIFLNQVVEGYALVLVHHTDVGGIAPGSNSAFSTEIYQEGLRIPFLKLYDQGQPNETLFKIIEKNVSVPVKVLGDLRAQLAACHTGEKEFLQLLTKYGTATFRFYVEEMLNYAERLMRAEIAAMPDGVYEFTDFIDGLGEDPEPIVFHVKVTVQGDGIIVDWTGSSPQVKGGINAPVPFTHSAAYLAIRCVTSKDIPNNEGYMRPIKIVAPLGTIMNPTLPAACATRGVTGFRMLDTLLGALSKVVPDRVPAAGEGGCTFPSIGGYHNETAFVHTESILGAWGGRPGKDGVEGIVNPGANQSNQPVELIEADYPIEILRYSLVQDSGGPGKYRGGLSLLREYRLLAEEAILSMRSDRRDHPPYGLQGGKAGTPSWNIINPGPNQRILPVLPMEGVVLKKGDVLCHIQAGGGGYNNPLERDPQKVLEDVVDEKQSVEYVKREYGIVINPKTMSLDLEATKRLREKMAKVKA